MTLEEYLDARIREYTERIVARYTCPRCNVPAWPTDPESDQGWCPICGMDPAVEGPPPPPAVLRGILRHPLSGRFMAGDCERDCQEQCAGLCGAW